jgi:Transposase DDE domain
MRVSYPHTLRRDPVQTHLRLLHTWQADLDRWLPVVRATRRHGFALVVAGLLWAGSVKLPRIAAALPLGRASVPSMERRVQRWLANEAIDPESLWTPVLPALLPQVAGPAPVFVLDPTDLPGKRRLVVLGVAVRQRVLPLAWSWQPSQEPWDQRLHEVVAAMAPGINAALPPGVVPTVLADAGLSGPGLLGACVDAGWHYLLRLPVTPNSSHRVRCADGHECPLWELVSGPGQHSHAAVEVFKGAGWLPVQLTIRWVQGCAAPWILVSDHVAGGAAVCRYRRRSHIEATFQDAKSRVFDLPTTKLRAPDRLARLVAALVLAVWWAALLALQAIHSGQRTRYERADRREIGLLRFGLVVFHHLCDHPRRLVTPFSTRAVVPCTEQTVRE